MGKGMIFFFCRVGDAYSNNYGGERMIKADEESLNYLRNALETAGEDYKRNLTRLQNLINEITRGDIQGTPATDLLTKFQAKEDIFRKLANTIDEAEEYMGIQKTKFTSMIGSLSSGMK